jgi:SAM-dependent methyltransferase
MGFYRKHILPRLLHLSMRNREATRLRQQVIPQARGRVLEIGVGSGLNLPFYSPDVTEVVGIDPSEELLAMARRAARRAPVPVRLEAGSAETLPFPDDSFDTVVTTWTLCSIPDAAKALREMQRVLRPGGRLLFVEHGRSPDDDVERWQHRLTPLWRGVSGGCNLDRPIDALIRGAGFALTDLETGYLVKGPRLLAHHFKGRAEPAPSRDRDQA